MEPKRRQTLLLGGLAIVLTGAVYIAWPASTATPDRPVRPRGAAKGTVADRAATAPDVRLESLDASRPEPGDAGRNLFKFKSKYVPPPPPVVAPPVPVSQPVPIGPPPPPPVPPIGLKFIGVIDAPGSPRIAILSDGRGAPFYGKEGESVLGQYKILRIGTESIEMDYIDGRGRQTIRLSGT